MRAWDALKLLAADQARHMRDADHVTVFLRALRALIRAGKAHLASAAGTAPASFRRWGWRARETFSVAAGAGESYDPGGECIGWVAEDDVYLDSSASYKAARQWAEQAGISLGVSRDQLSDDMAARGVVAGTDKDRSTVRRDVAGKRSHRVIYLTVSQFESYGE